ncbi:hypothetical protein [Deinococcus pimensis]|uniref:hypothetical protein n=1 Tax=Deinococcus pimensis TaxID=309888 RepID=UPI000483321A|nr:hypothetical protein [Deinococcus pimensis]
MSYQYEYDDTPRPPSSTLPESYSGVTPGTPRGATFITRAEEGAVLGHLLGRRESALMVARSTGMSAARAEAVCEALYQQGRLSFLLRDDVRMYSVSFAAHR